MKKKRYFETVQVKTPCTEEWDDMAGNDQVRFCSHCAKDVNNLSAMTRRDALRLVRRSNGRLCIRYIMHPRTKSPIFAEQLIQISRRAPRVAAGVMGASLSLSTLAYAQGGAVRVTKEPAPAPQIEKPLPVEKEPTVVMIDSVVLTEQSSSQDQAFIAGTIVDQTDAVIAGAIVTLSDEAGNELLTTTTNDEGRYRLENVPLAKVKLAASAPGFRTFISEIRIREAKERVVNMTLLVGAITGDMIVVGGAAGHYDGEIIKAVDDDDIGLVRELVARGEDVNKREDDDTTPIFIAVERGNLEMVRLLIQIGAKVNVRNDEKLTPLMMLGENSSLELVELLLAKGAKVNAVAKNGDTALIRAAREAKTEVLQALIDAEAELDVQNDEGVTALMNAADNENLESVRLLVLAGADINLRDKAGDNAWDYTAEDEIEAFLVSHGIQLDPGEAEDLDKIEYPELEDEPGEKQSEEPA